MTGYVENKLSNISDSKHFSIFDSNETRLICTVTLPGVNYTHKAAGISFIIGHPDKQGRVYATEAVNAVTHFCFNEGCIIKLYAGYYDGNLASAKVLEKNGFQIEGRIRQRYVNSNGERVVQIMVGLLNEEFRKLREIYLTK